MPKIKLKYKRPNVKQIPPCTEEQRQSTAGFLEYMRSRIERALNDHRVFVMTDKSPRTVGMVRHFRQQLATITYLQSINDQRLVSDLTNGP